MPPQAKKELLKLSAAATYMADALADAMQHSASVDVASHNKVVAVPFKGETLFGEALEPLLVKRRFCPPGIILGSMNLNRGTILFVQIPSCQFLFCLLLFHTGQFQPLSLAYLKARLQTAYFLTPQVYHRNQWGSVDQWDLTTTDK